ncbi:probable inhibitor of growth protein 1 homolog at N-terminal half [Coccomyxa sp. Obi]|nr:probable inhibitor of growth protein 1 homolog at N-terminal half [Coccomyxa sp. Obi]
MSNIIYLENFIENTGGLPPELTRILLTIKDLDERASDIRERIAQNVETFLDKPMPPTRKGMSDLPEEFASLKKTIEEDQRTYVQWQEEKLSLATIAVDLVQQHRAIIDQDIGSLLTELKATEYEDDLAAMEYTPPEETNRRQRQREIEAAAAAEREQKEAKRREREAAEAERRQAAEAAAEAAALAAAVAAEEAAQVKPEPKSEPASRQQSGEFSVPAPRQPKAANTGKGNRKEPEMAITPTAIAPAPEGPSSTRKKNAASHLPMHMPANVNLSGRISPINSIGPNTGQYRALGSLPGILSQPMPMEQDRGGEEEDAPPPYMPIVPQGMSTSAPAPQALGRLLTHADINERLKGRRAELYWPDDNLWYLIEIHEVDTTNHKAQIMYVTGETEELDLLEIVREGHMSLISENSGGRAYL